MQKGESQWSHTTVVDPCAGEGDVIIAFSNAIGGKVRVQAVEMEAKRFEALKARPYTGRVTVHKLHSDAFCVDFTRECADVLYLNPPYDTDPDCRRLEEKFLRRWACVLDNGGWLVFIVPHYALAASAETIGREFDQVACWRFPTGDFEVFKQVVLVGRKIATLNEPDSRVVELVRGWSESVDGMPVLPKEPTRELKITQCGIGAGFWRALVCDVKAISKAYVPWSQTNRSGKLEEIPGAVPKQLGARTFPVAMPPRPAHIAAGIASGVFDGTRLEPNEPSLPPLLVKGVFNREFKTVDERVNKDGDKTGEIQVQQPVLKITALNLETKRLFSISPSGELTGSRDVETFTTADLLERYGASMLKQLVASCPVMHDPARDAADHAPVTRPLFKAQAHAVTAAVKLLGGRKAKRSERRGKAAIVLGEIGSGKSSCALAISKTIESRRTLILCPPHLLESWRDQAAAVVPEVPTTILRDVDDVESFARGDGGIAILSRETAKLGHAVLGIEGITKHSKPRCPKCGSRVPTEDLGKKRARCEHEAHTPANEAAIAGHELANVLATAFAKEERVRQWTTGRVRMRSLSKWSEHPIPCSRWRALPIIERLVSAWLDEGDYKTKGILEDAILRLCLFACGGVEVIATRLVYASGWCDGYYAVNVRDLARKMLMIARVSEAEIAPLRAGFPESGGDGQYGGGNPWFKLVENLEALTEPNVVLAGEYYHFRKKDGALYYRDVPALDGKQALEALAGLSSIARFNRAEACGEPLFQAVPEPRRVPLATYIARRHPRLFDLWIADEAHEYSSETSAQSHAAHRLAALGIPTLLLTGSIMNGYAESLFANLWAVSPAFRAEFGRDERKAFVDRYGYRKQLVENKDKESGKVVAYGAVTDRVERVEREMGNAPGVLPLLILRHLLPISVTLHKADLALDLPPCREIAVPVETSEELSAAHSKLLSALNAQIVRDRFDPELAGKLWGAMAELPSHLDRAAHDTGNVDDGSYVISYPDGPEVARVGPLAVSVLPKEQWMLDTVRAELVEGRRVMVFAWHERVLPRLQRLINEIEPCAMLIASKVATAKRQAWIDKEVIGKKRRVLVVNPVAVQTGLNNLVHFATEIWMQSPACNPIIYRQAVGRVDRIGQKSNETRIYYPYYSGTTQAGLHKLLLRKVAVSLSTDGLDAESALAAAGVGSDNADASLSVGKQLYDLIERGELADTRVKEFTRKPPVVVTEGLKIETPEVAIQTTVRDLPVEALAPTPKKRSPRAKKAKPSEEAASVDSASTEEPAKEVVESKEERSSSFRVPDSTVLVDVPFTPDAKLWAEIKQPVPTDDLHPIVAEALRLGWDLHKAQALEPLARDKHFVVEPLFAGFWRNPKRTPRLETVTHEDGTTSSEVAWLEVQPGVWTSLADEQPANNKAAEAWATEFARSRGWTTNKGLVWT